MRVGDDARDPVDRHEVLDVCSQVRLGGVILGPGHPGVGGRRHDPARVPVIQAAEFRFEHTSSISVPEQKKHESGQRRAGPRTAPEFPAAELLHL